MEARDLNYRVEAETIYYILQMYGFDEPISEQCSYIDNIGEDQTIKLIFRVTLTSGKMLVIKILHEQNDLLQERKKIEKQSIFSEMMRSQGIKTPTRYQTNGTYCCEYIYNNIPCNVTVEDWCGEEIKEIDTAIAYQIGRLMARMHIISLDLHYEIGCKTMFSAAYENDVDAYSEFCKICEDERLNQQIVSKIKAIRDEKLAQIRDVWDTLPKAAVQGDMSINNLVYGVEDLIIFDYNNAGDEVLVSDFILEGLLTAYEMDIQSDMGMSYRESLFSAMMEGYLSVRKLNDAESAVVWNIYTLYHALWFSRIVYLDDSLEKLVGKGDYERGNKLLEQILSDITEQDNGMFKR